MIVSCEVKALIYIIIFKERKFFGENVWRCAVFFVILQSNSDYYHITLYYGRQEEN